MVLFLFLVLWCQRGRRRDRGSVSFLVYFCELWEWWTICTCLLVVCGLWNSLFMLYKLLCYSCSVWWYIVGFLFLVAFVWKYLSCALSHVLCLTFANCLTCTVLGGALTLFFNMCIVTHWLLSLICTHLGGAPHLFYITKWNLLHISMKSNCIVINHQKGGD